MARIRVIRIIEHEYESQEAADADMTNWYLSGTGVRHFAHLTMRWATTYPATLFNDSEEKPDGAHR